MEPKFLLAKRQSSFASINPLKRMMAAADKIAYARHPIQEIVDTEEMMIRSSPDTDEVKQLMVGIGRNAADSAKAAREAAMILRSIMPDVRKFLSEVEDGSD